MPHQTPVADPGDESLADLQARAEALQQAGREEEATELLRRGLIRSLLISARAMEASGDVSGALDSYRQAIQHSDDPDLTAKAGRLALRAGKPDMAQALLTRHIQAVDPTSEVIANLGLAHALMGEFEAAHEALKASLVADAGQPVVWRALAEVLCVQGRHEQAVVFFEEALRLDPSQGVAKAGLADALLLSNADPQRALALSEEVLAGASSDELSTATKEHARRLLGCGQLEAGWTALAGVAPREVKAAAREWTAGEPMNGRLLVIGEESIADAVLMLPSAAALAAEGMAPILALPPRLGRLAHRSFPGATVTSLVARTHQGERQRAAELDTPHIHEGRLVAAWTSAPRLMALRRGRIEDFAGQAPYLRPDPERVAAWRGQLDGSVSGLKVGVVWRAAEPNRSRPWEAPPVGLFTGAMSVPGLHLTALREEAFLNEHQWLEEGFGMKVAAAPVSVYRGDLDEVAALACAMDLVVGTPCAETYVAAACGVETWFLSPPRHWARFGADVFPGFPQARVFTPASPEDWTDAMSALFQALSERAKA